MLMTAKRKSMGRTYWNLALFVLVSLSMLGRSSVAKAQQHTKGPNTDLIAAIKNDDTRGALRALKAGANPNLKDEETHLSPLFLLVGPKVNEEQLVGFSAGADNPTVVKALLARGAVVDERDEDGRSPLTFAAEAGQVHTVQLLLDHGADANVIEHIGYTTLMRGVLSHKSAIIRLLLHHGARINQTPADGESALMYAAMNGTANIVRLLLRAGALVNAQDRDGETALDYAEQPRGEDGGEPSPSIIKVLKDWGAVHGRKSPHAHG
jgi:hypothetical protein